jgi:hypothetical protein
MASPLSKPVKPETIAGAIGRGAGAAGLAEGAGAETRAGVAGPADDEGAGALAGAGAATGTATTATGAAAALADGDPPGARVGNLIVGADVGLGGKLMRTVSFFGWTFDASAGLGGWAPPGDVGILSAITFYSAFNVKLPLLAVKPELQHLTCIARIVAPKDAGSKRGFVFFFSGKCRLATQRPAFRSR